MKFLKIALTMKTQIVLDEEIVEEIELKEDFLITNLKINLDLAGIFYQSANNHIIEGNKKFTKLKVEIAKYEKIYAVQAKKCTLDSEDFFVNQIKNLRSIEVFYEPVIKHFSTAKILLVCCVETYINEVMSISLKGRSFDEFDKLSITGKWIFSQELLRHEKKIPLNRNPFQDFAKLIAERNKLVHFKGVSKSLKRLEIPNYIQDLKLTPEDCLRNVKAVKDLIREFSLNWTGSSGPDWLDKDEHNYRDPCFYLNNRESSMTLYSEKHDKNRYK